MISTRGVVLTLMFAQEVGRRRRLGLRAVIRLQERSEPSGGKLMARGKSQREGSSSQSIRQEVTPNELSKLVRLIARSTAASDHSLKPSCKPE